jgi:hypothetical protein
MKILFLDFDGVLNSNEWFTSFERSGRSPKAEQIDPEAVARLNRVVEASGARIVVSSSWRLGHTVGELQQILEDRGFRGEIVGTTPDLSAVRGQEVLAWLSAQAEVPEAFCILDDSNDMAGLLPHLVRTSWRVGLSDADADAAILMLGVTSNRTAGDLDDPEDFST